MGMLPYLIPWLLLTAVAADPYEEPHTLNNRQVMVHLFEWKWKDIAAECENFLQHYGYGAVQVSPPMEHITLTQNGDMPWWIRYQPVSYKLNSRSGTEQEFVDMVNRCNAVGVRIIVDAVINHMTGVSQKKGVNGRDSSGGSFFDGTDGVESFPEVPYSKNDFNDWRCHGDIKGSDYGGNAQGVRNCRLVGLLDLDQGKDYVRGKIIGYFNHLIDLGVAGFRVDASKHMWPGDLKAIMDGTKNLRADIYGANQRPFFAHEVIDRGGEAIKCAEYTELGRYINFNYGPIISQAARGGKDWGDLKWFGKGYGYGNLESKDVLVFIDNHDNQRGGDVLTYKNGDQYAMAVAFMLAWPYGYPRVMSSYYFSYSDQGPPSAGPGGGYVTKSPYFKKDETCEPGSGFVCEHRWPAIRGMAKWRSMVEGSGTENVVSEWNRLAFSRGGKGFFAINGKGDRWNVNFQTSLPQGQYCDVWSGYLKDGRCTGKTINVGGDGRARIEVDKIVAISLASKIGYNPDPPPQPTQGPGPQPQPTQGPGPQPQPPSPIHYDDPYDDPNTVFDRQVMVHLFEWKWKDVAAECENFLQHHGYGAVQVSPPMEHIILTQNGDMPWWIRYQPVSYKLNSRSGTEQEFVDMVNRCNAVGVRIIVDTVINHMTGVDQKKGVNGRDSSGGSFFDGMNGVESFPEVPYSENDFNDWRCAGNIQGGDYGSNAAGVRNCRLVGLLDLDQGKDYVRGKIIGYLNHLIDIGVAGFRVDASKHMWPGDLKDIMDGTKNLRADIYGANKRPFFAHEVIDRGGEAIKCAEYTGIGRYINFNYGPVISQAARGGKDWGDLKWFGKGYGYGNLDSHDVLVFIDNHDNQRGGDVLTYKNGEQYSMAVAFMLAWPYGYPRVMSSFYFSYNDQGPPSAGPGGGYATKSPSFKQDDTCEPGSGFVCEHRWIPIRGMAKWRSMVEGTETDNVVAEWNRLAFSRGGKGFFAINGKGDRWNVNFQTSLPQGQYCDVWSGYLKDGKCTGKTITVGSDGRAQTEVDKIVAISLASKIGYEPDPPKPKPTEAPQPKPTEAPQPQPTQGPQPQPTFPPFHYDDPYDDPSTWLNREVMVHLFEWKWKDIAAECENFLQYFGYGAVQVSPPMEHITLIQNNDMPWWVRYQPVSYKLISRSGDEEEFKDMVDRCNKVGVRIVVDAVINHMTGVAQKKGVATRDSSGGSFFDAMEGVESFPEVPYSQQDFNDYRCKGNIGSGDYGSNPAGVRNCRLVGLLDLDQSKTYVQGKIIGYLNHLIDLGVAGFRVDASKHMWPGDLKAIMDGTKNLREDIFGANKRAFFAHEVIDRGGEAITVSEYQDLGRYINFNYGPMVSQAARGHRNWEEMIEIGPGYGYGNAEGHDVLVFVDNHDNQRSGDVLTYKNGDQYKMAVAFMLGWQYGYPRVMSSYDFRHNDQGPPSEGPGNGFKTKSPTFNADLTCASSSGFVCEHRWPQVRGMTLWRSTVYGTKPSEVVQEYKKLAFAHQGKGFFAINGEDTWSRSFQTTLPSGQYCDVWTGFVQNGKCTGKTITVGSDGKAQIEIDGVVAISLASKIGSSPGPGPDPPQPPTQAPGPQPPTQAPGPQPTPDPRGFTKTVILLKRDTAIGQYVFIRGGTSHMNNGVCPPGSNDKCAVPIKHNTQVPGNFLEYLAWSQGDSYLDFHGPENGQQSFNGRAASGTPLAYSSNNPGDKEYQPYNKYGRGYWIAELMMDCSKTENGWFELKGFLTPSNQWENDIHQGSCGGTVGGAAPFQSINHIAKCGAVNVFIWGNSGCTIDQV